MTGMKLSSAALVQVVASKAVEALTQASENGRLSYDKLKALSPDMYEYLSARGGPTDLRGAMGMVYDVLPSLGLGALFSSNQAENVQIVESIERNPLKVFTVSQWEMPKGLSELTAATNQLVLDHWSANGLDIAMQASSRSLQRLSSQMPPQKWHGKTERSDFSQAVWRGRDPDFSLIGGMTVDFKHRLEFLTQAHQTLSDDPDNVLWFSASSSNHSHRVCAVQCVGDEVRVTPMGFVFGTTLKTEHAHWVADTVVFKGGMPQLRLPPFPWVEKAALPETQVELAPALCEAAGVLGQLAEHPVWHRPLSSGVEISPEPNALNSSQARLLRAALSREQELQTRSDEVLNALAPRWDLVFKTLQEQAETLSLGQPVEYDGYTLRFAKNSSFENSLYIESKDNRFPPFSISPWDGAETQTNTYKGPQYTLRVNGAAVGRFITGGGNVAFKYPGDGFQQEVLNNISKVGFRASRLAGAVRMLESIVGRRPLFS